MSTAPAAVSILERIKHARPDQFTPQELAVARTILHAQANVCRIARPLPPPDDILLSQILTAAPLFHLVRLLQDLVDEHAEPPNTYEYFLSVALQRIHRIQPATRPRP
jgi:hypothetical protein